MKDIGQTTKKRVAIITNNLHCERHVQYFSTIEKYFVTNGWDIAEDFEVNKIVIVSCGFHNAMYDKIKRALEEIKKSNFLEKNIIMMGCLTKTHEADVKENFKGQIVGYHCEELLDQMIRPIIPFKDIRPVNLFNLNDKSPGENKPVDYFHIKIAEGCLRECTFCVINKAKGYIKSVPYEKIREQVEIAVKQKQRRIKLTAEDTFAYGIDIGTDVIQLIEKLTAAYPGIDLYFGYLHIRWLAKYARQIISFCKRGIFKELHIGLQHINEEMLRKMGRPARFHEIYDILGQIKKDNPDFYLVADILVGFPGETDDIFNQLVQFFKKDKYFNKVKHFGYSDVKGSRSSNFKNKIPAEVTAQRWETLDKILGERAYSNREQEDRLDNETFRITRFQDYSFCKDTFNETVEVVENRPEFVFAGSNVLEKDEGDFEF